MRTTTLFTLVFAVMLVSCYRNGSHIVSGSNQGIDSVIIGTVVDSSESQQPELFSTPDLILFELKGNVKEVRGRISARFDKEGRLTHYCSYFGSTCEKIFHLERDSGDRVTSLLSSTWIIKVGWDGDRPASLVEEKEPPSSDDYDRRRDYDRRGITWEMGFFAIDKYVYDENDRVVKTRYRKRRFIEPGYIADDYVITYPQDAFDSCGNWLRRIIIPKCGYLGSSEIEGREIIYY